MGELLTGEKFIEDDEYKIKFVFEKGHMVKIDIEIKDKKFFPQCNAEDKKLVSHWIKWMNSQIYSALMQAPTKKMEEALSQQEAQKNPQQLGVATRRNDNDIRPVFNHPPMKEIGETTSGAKPIACPSCGAEVLAKKKCCGNKGWEGICHNCRKKIFLPEL